MSYSFDLTACWLGSCWEFTTLARLGTEGLRSPWTDPT